MDQTDIHADANTKMESLGQDGSFEGRSVIAKTECATMLKGIQAE